ncbi:Signal recognition particle core component [Ascosphaera aggregata]|nr:Signal recognition particle core component [Ascosphaera aggregata]
MASETARKCSTYEDRVVDCTLPLNLDNLKKKSVVITGGATGLGCAYVKAFAAAGAFVTFGDIKEEAGHELAAATPSCDVRSWDDQVRLFECAMVNNETFSCDIVIANAGVSAPDGKSILDDAGMPAVKPDTTHLDTNTTGLLYTAKLALHYFRRSPVIQSQDRCLILISSMGAYIDLPGSSMYSMSKFATRGLMRSLRRGNWLGLNRVNIVAPWFIKTHTYAKTFLEKLEREGIQFASYEDAVRAVLRCASDVTINGRAIGILPREYCSTGYVDLAHDDHSSDTDMGKWQDIALRLGGWSIVVQFLFPQQEVLHIRTCSHARNDRSALFYPSSMAATLSALFKRSSIDDPEDVLKTCNVALQSKKTDVNILHAKVVALLKLDRYDDALRTLDQAGDQLKDKAAFERAYALYKIGKLQEAIAIAKKLSSQHRGAAHVEAQSSYRAEDFERSAELYQLLQADEEASSYESGDIRVNSTAVDVQLQFATAGDSIQSKNPTREDLQAFETTYNVATAAIGKGELSKAALLLRRAEELCRSSDELTPEDKESELLPIQVQQLYVATKTGNKEETERLIKEIDFGKINESSTKQIGINNALLSTSSSMSPYLLFKAFHETPVPADTDRLFSFQRRILTVNSQIIDILAHKYKGVARSTSKTLSRCNAPTSSADVNILSPLNVAAHVERERASKVGSTNSLRQKATNLLKQRPRDVGLLLTVIQLNIEESRYANALTLLKTLFDNLDKSISESDQDVRYSPGLISIYVALCNLLGNHFQAQVELKKAAKFWQSRADQAPSLLRSAGAALVGSFHSHNDLALAGDIFTRLLELNPSDTFAKAGFIAAYAVSEPEKVSSEASYLTNISELISDIDVRVLEENGVANLPKSLQISKQSAKRTAAELAARDPSASQQPKKKRRLRGSRIPKDFDPNRQPDPERWLPLRDRSSYRPPKGRKTKQRSGDRMQGGVVAEENTLSAQSSPVITQPKSGGAGSSSKKKKGKGRR